MYLKRKDILHCAINMIWSLVREREKRMKLEMVGTYLLLNGDTFSNSEALTITVCFERTFVPYEDSNGKSSPFYSVVM